MKNFVFVLLGLTMFEFAFISSQSDLFPYPQNWPKPAYNFQNNPLSKEKILLGRALFYDPILSKDSTISCASCHSQFNAFTHADHALSHGILDQIGKRNSPALMNLAWQKSFMWDGAINHLDMQALAPITHPAEMGENIPHVLKKLKGSLVYRNLFQKAFSDTIITSQHMLLAISQFMLTLVSSNAKYDSVMRGESQFSVQEEKGYLLFKKYCNSCHTAPLFTNLTFKNNGIKMDDNLRDLGRFAITHQALDSFKFKVPTLRNIEFSFPYMHDGRFKTLAEVLNHYQNLKQTNTTYSNELSNLIILSKADKVDLTAFLLCLTDKSFLFNKEYSYPRNLFFTPTKD